MRDGRLGVADLLDDFADGKPFAADEFHDVLTSLVRDGFGEEDGAEFHNGYYIDDRLFVKRAAKLGYELVPAA